MTRQIEDLPAKEEVAGIQPYDEADAEDERKIHTVRPVLFPVYAPNPFTYEGAVVCNPEHRDYMIEPNT